MGRPRRAVEGGNRAVGNQQNSVFRVSFVVVVERTIGSRTAEFVLDSTSLSGLPKRRESVRKSCFSPFLLFCLQAPSVLYIGHPSSPYIPCCPPFPCAPGGNGAGGGGNTPPSPPNPAIPQLFPPQRYPVSSADKPNPSPPSPPSCIAARSKSARGLEGRSKGGNPT
jgi:hypothetical protein